MSDASELKIYFALQRLMKNFSISRACLPSDLKKWKPFFDRVNASFFDFEQERYLLERSMELSSNEFVEINRQFEEAESIAHIGHWSYRSTEEKILWSNQTFSIFGLKENVTPANYHQFLELIFEEDRGKLNTLVEDAITKGENYELEMRIYFGDDRSVRWVYARGMTTSIENMEEPSQPCRYNLSGTIMDIDERKRSEEESKQLNKRLIALSRQAGMSEVAASVLHNIGNILNSANVSIVMLRELLSHYQIDKLENIAKMLQEGITKNPEYLISDTKGKLVPTYLLKLSESFAIKQKEMIDEMEELNKHIDHIKDIVLMQNAISGIAGIKEKISIEDICNQAIQMSYGLDENNTIKIKQVFEFKGDVVVDKTKLIQILVNLIRNAKDALMLRETTEEKIINLKVKEYEKGLIEIQVSDNGIGIEPEYVKQIFSMGFTTKSSGHGFGLHMSAIAAREMGGALAFTSQGRDQGATFTLRFPIEYSGGGGGMNKYGHL